MEHELKGIRYQAEKYAKLTTLINRVNEESLKEAHCRQKTGKAAGIDGMTKEDFDFLGFTFFNTRTRGGKYRLGVRTSKKKLKVKKQTVKAWLMTRLTKPVADTMKLINLSLAGHYNYYGVSGNYHAIQGFWKYIKYATYRMLNRRDQKGKFR